jgi:hypothetical protein
MRLPKDPENWSGWHADKAIAEAWRLFKRYEDRIDFTWPQARQDALYRPYLLAREVACDVSRYTSWRAAEAERLP